MAVLLLAQGVDRSWCRQLGMTRPKFTGQQTEDHGIAARPLEGQVRPQHALACEPAALRNALRSMVIGPAGDLEPRQVQRFESPPSDESHRPARYSAAARSRGKPVAKRRTTVLVVDPVEGNTPQQRPNVSPSNNGEVDLLVPQTSLLLIPEAPTSLFATERLPVGVDQENRIAKRLHLLRHIGFVPGAQDDLLVRQRRERQLDHHPTP